MKVAKHILTLVYDQKLCLNIISALWFDASRCRYIEMTVRKLTRHVITFLLSGYAYRELSQKRILGGFITGVLLASLVQPLSGSNQRFMFSQHLRKV